MKTETGTTGRRDIMRKHFLFNYATFFMKVVVVGSLENNLNKNNQDTKQYAVTVCLLLRFCFQCKRWWWHI